MGAIGDGQADDTSSIQRGIDRVAQKGGVLELPPGQFRTSAPIKMRSGVTLVGSGRHVEVTASGLRFTGSWINGPGIELHSVQNCAVRGLGINCEQHPGAAAISIGSDNNPSCKSHVIENFAIFGASLGVRWGLGNKLAKLEQCDDITIRDGALHSCAVGFRFDAANGSDFSRIERCSFSALREIAFDMRSAGFLTIENCAAGTVGNAVMFRITDAGPDPIRIIGCQSEPSGRFLVAEGTNDQGVIILEGNVVNMPIEARGVRRFVSRANYLNSTVGLDGYIRWSSYDDVRDPGERHQRQISTANGAQFHASTLKDAARLSGLFLGEGTRIEGNDPASSELVTRAGIYCPPFAATGTYAAGDYFKLDGTAYQVEHAGKAAAKLVNGASGSVRAKAIGPAAQIARLGVVERI